jgi:diadenosine tetraphosphate (Ap4A) HIT family hydrolase
MSYDENNIFARILRGDIPATRIYEDDYVIAINDIAPQAPVHILVMPKGKYVSFDDFSAKASDAEIVALTRAIGKIAHDAGLDGTGYRLLLNHGPDSHQEVPHFHIHILGGKPLGPLLARD